MKKYKIIIPLALILIIANVLSISVSAKESEYSWYCQRTGNKQPNITYEENLISKYEGYCIDRSVTDKSSDKVLYITFDAGYENGNVERILNVMKKENISAAFFLLDNIILKNPELVTRMVNEGHTVCNHTKNHKNLCDSSKTEIANDLKSLENLFESTTGLTMQKFFRFPEGKYSEQALKFVSELGYKTVFWSFAYDDWDNSRQMDKNKAFKKIIENTHNGAVILLHPTSSVNASIMPQLIKEWKSMGYRFGTLDELASKN